MMFLRSMAVALLGFLVFNSLLGVFGLALAILTLIASIVLALILTARRQPEDRPDGA